MSHLYIHQYLEHSTRQRAFSKHSNWNKRLVKSFDTNFTKEFKKVRNQKTYLYSWKNRSSQIQVDNCICMNQVDFHTTYCDYRNVHRRRLYVGIRLYPHNAFRYLCSRDYRYIRISFANCGNLHSNHNYDHPYRSPYSDSSYSNHRQRAVVRLADIWDADISDSRHCISSHHHYRYMKCISTYACVSVLRCVRRADSRRSIYAYTSDNIRRPVFPDIYTWSPDTVSVDNRLYRAGRRTDHSQTWNWRHVSKSYPTHYRT